MITCIHRVSGNSVLSHGRTSIPLNLTYGCAIHVTVAKHYSKPHRGLPLVCSYGVDRMPESMCLGSGASYPVDRDLAINPLI